MTDKTDKLDAELRPNRVCDVCGGVDTHPRHVHGVEPGGLAAPNKDLVELVTRNAASLKADVYPLMTDLFDTSTQTRHIDCCREAGCPDGTCNSAPDLKGMALVKAIVNGGK